jgi:hypothetical protein
MIFSQPTNSPHFMEPEVSWPLSQMPITYPFSKPARASPCPCIPLPEDPYQYYPPIYTWVSQVNSFPQVSSPKPLYSSPIPHTCYMPRTPYFLDLVIRTILGEEYRSWSSSLRSFLHSPVTLKYVHYFYIYTFIRVVFYTSHAKICKLRT